MGFLVPGFLAGAALVGLLYTDPAPAGVIVPAGR